MRPETAQRMNELARMTPAEREDELIREVFAPLFEGTTLLDDIPDHLPSDMGTPTIGEES